MTSHLKTLPTFLDNTSELLSVVIDLLLEMDRSDASLSEGNISSVDRATAMLVIGRDAIRWTLAEIEAP